MICTATGKATAFDYGTVGSVKAKSSQTNREVSDSDSSYYKIKSPTTPKTASLGDKVWYDDNHNGIQDKSEGGVAGVSVTLYRGNQSVGTTTTDSHGEYLFSNLPAGDYYLKFDLSSVQSGYRVTTQDVGSDDSKDSDVNPDNGMTPTITLAAGTTDRSWDMGLYKPTTPAAKGSVGDRVWYDDNHNGLQESGETGVENVAITLYDKSGTEIGTTLTDTQGAYSFEDIEPGEYYLKFDPSSLPESYRFTKQDEGSDESRDSDVNPQDGKTGSFVLHVGEKRTTLDAGIFKPTSKPNLGSIGGIVWHDENHNGILEEGEKGVQGIKVSLYDANDMQVNSTTTDKNGRYNFDNLTPGSYHLKCDQDAIIANGYKITLKDQGNNEMVDSDADPADGTTPPTTLDAGENDTSWHIGLYKPKATIQLASLGDRVWYDTNGNGIQDSGERGAENISVTLYEVDGSEVATARTDSNGLYKFEDLYPGEYYIVFDLATLPKGYVITKRNQGSDESQDSDPALTTGKTVTIRLEGGEDDTSWDMGLVKTYRVGGLFWVDGDNNGKYDEGEDILPNATVDLVDKDGNVIASTKTKENGRYHFDVKEGTYKVRFHIPPAYLEKNYDFEKNVQQGMGIEEDGLITTTASVGPQKPTQVLSQDAAIICPCADADIEANGGSALSLMGSLMMLFMVLMGGLYYIRREAML